MKTGAGRWREPSTPASRPLSIGATGEWGLRGERRRVAREGLCVCVDLAEGGSKRGAPLRPRRRREAAAGKCTSDPSSDSRCEKASREACERYAMVRVRGGVGARSLAMTTPGHRRFGIWFYSGKDRTRRGGAPRSRRKLGSARPDGLPSPPLWQRLNKRRSDGGDGARQSVSGPAPSWSEASGTGSTTSRDSDPPSPME